ncbi:hypothetical protein NDU88_005565 [Pleurodeles waltl]|uniref:Uncharacterized protein n=1 Tax=Pleurodeles waltl TaxID=8319 RepID=A0AAV7WY13_PLEWA|nr:hypothetical protein NDU88_005565 [Pleurodeles waltl]
MPHKNVVYFDGQYYQQVKESVILNAKAANDASGSPSRRGLSCVDPLFQSMDVHVPNERMHVTRCAWLFSAVCQVSKVTSYLTAKPS